MTLTSLSVTDGPGSTSIVEAPLKSIVKAGYSAEFQCTASVPQMRTVMFEVFGGSIKSPSESNSCNTSLTTQICTDSIGDHPVTLTCDYSVGFQISCTLRIDNFMESQSNNVSCKIMNGKMVETSKTVGRIVEGKETMCMCVQHLCVIKLVCCYKASGRGIFTRVLSVLEHPPKIQKFLF